MLRRTMLKLAGGLPLLAGTHPETLPEKEDVPLPANLRDLRSVFQTYINRLIAHEALANPIMGLLFRSASFNHSGTQVFWRHKINGRFQELEKRWQWWSEPFVCPATFKLLQTSLDTFVHQWCIRRQLDFLEDIHPIFCRRVHLNGSECGQEYGGRRYSSPDWRPRYEKVTPLRLPGLFEASQTWRFRPDIALLSHNRANALRKIPHAKGSAVTLHGIRVLDCGNFMSDRVGYLLRDKAVRVPFLTANMLEPTFNEFGVLNRLESYGTFTITNISYVTLLEFE